MTTIKIADDWLDAVRASLGARCRLGRPARTGDARRLRRAQRSVGCRARLRQHRRAGRRRRGDHHRSAAAFRRHAGGSASIDAASRSRSPTCCRCSINSASVRSTSERSGSCSTAQRCGCTMSVSRCRPASQLTDAIKAEVQRCFLAEFSGSIEVDGLNRLVLLGGLTSRQIEILRAYSRYLRQIGFPFSQQYIEATLVRHAHDQPPARCAVHRAVRSRSPSTTSSRPRQRLRAEIAEALDAVPSLDDDRTLRALLALIDATVRTNAFRPATTAGIGRCWRSSSTRRRCPTFRCRDPCSRSGCARRASRACICATAASPAVAFAGVIAARTSAPRSSGSSRRRSSRTRSSCRPGPRVASC